MSSNVNMTKGDPLKLIFVFALPLMLGNIFQQLYTVVDTAIVGKGVGMDALAALGCVDWLNWMMIGIAQAVTQGFAIRTSQKFGEGDIAGLKKFCGQSAVLSAVLAVLYFLIVQSMLPVFLRLLHVPPELSPMSELYTRIILCGTPIVFFFNYCSATLRAVGNSKTPLKAMIIAALTNIVLDALAVFVLDMGIAGAAIATVLAQCLSGIVCALKVYNTPELRFVYADLKPSIPILKNLIMIGMPSALRNMIIAFGGMTVQTIVNGFGTGFIAGFTATNKLYGVLEIAAISYGYAITTYVGQNYGAGNHMRIKQGLKASVKLAICTSLVIAAIMIGFGKPITSLFISSDIPELLAEAKRVSYLYLCTMASFLPVLYLLYIFQGLLQGVGDTVNPMISGIIEFFVRVSIALIIGYTGYELGIFSAEIFAWFGAAAYMLFHSLRKVKKLNTRPYE